MQKTFSKNTHVFSASNQIIVNDAFINEMQQKANKLRAKAFAQFINFIAFGVSSLFLGVANWFSSKSKNRRVMDQLYAMDDRSLADIGLTRGDIESVSKGTWRGASHQKSDTNFETIQKNTVKRTDPEQVDNRIAA
jgi:uncharacterized protein YjiS (DUF1127 family)